MLLLLNINRMYKFYGKLLDVCACGCVVKESIILRKLVYLSPGSLITFGIFFLICLLWSRVLGDSLAYVGVCQILVIT